VKSLTSSNKWL